MCTYINGAGFRSINNEHLSELFPKNRNYAKGETEKIKNVSLRRLSTLVRNCLRIASASLSEAEVSNVNGIVTATSWGCLTDTERFIEEVFAADEETLAPTRFIQSTHNSVGAQIALMLSCNNYNLTYSQGKASFESALIDASMLLSETKGSILVGGYDELTDHFRVITERMGKWRNSRNSSGLLVEKKAGFAGEGSTFFVMSSFPQASTYAQYLGTKILYDLSVAKEELCLFLKKNGIDKSDIDMVLVGADEARLPLQDNDFDSIVTVNYERFCGEYDTSLAFGYWIACNVLKYQYLPSSLNGKTSEQKNFHWILVLNSSSDFVSYTLLKRYVQAQ